MFKFTIYPSCGRALNNGMVKSKIFRKLSLNFTFGKGSCLMLKLARPNSSKTVLLRISLTFDIGIFNNNFAFCVAEFLESMMSSFCSMPWVAGWFLLRGIIKCTSVIYPVYLTKYWKKLDKHLWRRQFCESCTIIHLSLLKVSQTLC